MTAQALPLQALLIVLTAGAAVALGLSWAWSAEPDVAARVNGEPVTRGEVQRVLADPILRRRIQREIGNQQADRQAMERQALQKLINQRLILQEAARRNFTVTEQELSRGVSTFRRRLRDARKFAAWMKARGLDETLLREGIRAEILMTSVRAAVVRDVSITEDEIQAYYDAHKAELQTADEVRLRTIAVMDRVAADEVVTALNNGEEFERIARARSIEPRALEGGDTGWVGAETFRGPLREVVSALHVGEIAGPLDRDGQFVFVRLEDRKAARTKSLAEARAEFEPRLLVRKQQAVFEAWLKDQEKQSTIEVFLQTASLTTEGGKRSAIGDQLSASDMDARSEND